MGPIQRLNERKGRLQVKMTTIEYDTAADYIDYPLLGDIKEHYPDADMYKLVEFVDELKRLIWDEEDRKSGFILFSENTINDMKSTIDSLIQALEEEIYTYKLFKAWFQFETVDTISDAFIRAGLENHHFLEYTLDELLDLQKLSELMGWLSIKRRGNRD